MKRLAVATAVLALALSACGGGGRPSTEDIAKALKDGDTDISATAEGLDDDTADCVAKAFHDSDLSDDALQALVDGDDDYEGDEDDAKAAEGMSDELQKCVTG